MKLFALSLFALSLFAQTAVFPGAVVTDAQLGVATNNIQTLLSGSINSTATSFNVVSATGMAANQIATIDSENVWICGVSGLTVSVGRSACPNVDGRGFDGSAAVSHSANGANCNFGTASGCVSEFVVAWNHNAPAKEIEAVEAYLHTRPFFEAVRDYGADPTGATDSTTMLQAGLNAAKAAGACLHVQGSTTQQSFNVAGYVVPSPAYKISSPLTMTGNTCLLLDPTATIIQTSAVDGIDVTGSNTTISGGVLAYGIYAPSAIGISITDTSSDSASFNRVLGTKVYGFLVGGGQLGKCFSVTSNYSHGSYSNDLLEIYGQFCGTGVYESGLGVAGPGANSFVNLGNVTGSIDNSNQAAYFNYAGEKHVSLEMNGDANGILVDAVSGGGVTSNIDIADTRGGESSGYRVKFNNSGAQNNIFYRSGGCDPGTCMIDLSGGLNHFVNIEVLSTTIDVNGLAHTCVGACFNSAYFPSQTPQAVLDLIDPANIHLQNLLGIHHVLQVPLNTDMWLLFNPYQSSINSPFGGLFLHTAATYPAGAPVAYFSQGNTTSSSPSTSLWLGNGAAGLVMGGVKSLFTNVGGTDTTATVLQSQNNSPAGIQTTTGTAANASTAITVASGYGTVNGELVFGVGIQEGTTVASGGGTTAIVLSQATIAAIPAGTAISFTTLTDTFSARGDGAYGGDVIITVGSLPACNATPGPKGTLLQTVAVSDLTSPTLGSAPSGSGSVRGTVICGYSGSASAWHVSAF